MAKGMFTARPKGVNPSPLGQQDSLALFSRFTDILDDPEDVTARQIADARGDVPLAIFQMAGIIRRQDLTLEEFSDLYTDYEQQSTLYETKFANSLVTYRHSLSIVWAFEKLKPQARQLLELMSFLDPDTAGADLLIEGSMNLFSEGGQCKKRNHFEPRADLLQSSLIRRYKQK